MSSIVIQDLHERKLDEEQKTDGEKKSFGAYIIVVC
jgi:hypothetical protein